VALFQTRIALPLDDPSFSFSSKTKGQTKEGSDATDPFLVGDTARVVQRHKMNERSHLATDYNFYVNAAPARDDKTQMSHTPNDNSALGENTEKEEEDRRYSTNASEGESFPLMTNPYSNERTRPEFVRTKSK